MKRHFDIETIFLVVTIDTDTAPTSESESYLLACGSETGSISLFILIVVVDKAALATGTLIHRSDKNVLQCTCYVLNKDTFSVHQIRLCMYVYGSGCGGVYGSGLRVLSRCCGEAHKVGPVRAVFRPE